MALIQHNSQLRARRALYPCTKSMVIAPLWLSTDEIQAQVQLFTKYSKIINVISSANNLHANIYLLTLTFLESWVD